MTKPLKGDKFLPRDNNHSTVERFRYQKQSETPRLEKPNWLEHSLRADPSQRKAFLLNDLARAGRGGLDKTSTSSTPSKTTSKPTSHASRVQKPALKTSSQVNPHQLFQKLFQSGGVRIKGKVDEKPEKDPSTAALPSKELPRIPFTDLEKEVILSYAQTCRESTRFDLTIWIKFSSICCNYRLPEEYLQWYKRQVPPPPDRLIVPPYRPEKMEQLIEYIKDEGRNNLRLQNDRMRMKAQEEIQRQARIDAKSKENRGSERDNNDKSADWRQRKAHEKATRAREKKKKRDEKLDKQRRKEMHEERRRKEKVHQRRRELLKEQRKREMHPEEQQRGERQIVQLRRRLEEAQK